MTKQFAVGSLLGNMDVMASLIRGAADGDKAAAKALRSICTNRSYVGPQLEIGREELAVILADDDDDK